jgi:hypothetical protein
MGDVQIAREICMSDHFDAPGLNPPNMDARVDICDIYVFKSPEDASRSVLAFNVNPLAPTLADSFAPEAVYEWKVDTNGDAVAEIAYRFTFTPEENGMQLATVRRASGEQARGNGKEGEVLFRDVPVAFGKDVTVSEAGGYRFFAGMRSDPFFFDLEGFKKGMQFTGTDEFLDKNVFSIILEMPDSALGSNPRVGAWGRVLIPKDGNPFFQIDRMGRPWVNVAFTRDDDKDAFNRAEPTRDRELFTGKFTDLLASQGHSLENARQTALALLPDILDYDYASTAGYPNGRKLTDDIIDYQLNVLTNGAVTTDKVGTHRDLLSKFPYLGTPHPTARPEAGRSMITKTT